MTKIKEHPYCCQGPSPEGRKKMMRIMSEVSFNPASVNPAQQEELADFMVQQLKGNYCSTGSGSDV